MALTVFQTAQSFMQSMKNWILTGGGFVSQEIANARAAICVGCHNNVPTSEIKGGCSSCRKGASKIVQMLFRPFLGSRKTPVDAALKACQLCGCPLSVKVWMPLAAHGSKVEDANAWPTFCWRKAILQDKEI